MRDGAFVWYDLAAIDAAAAARFYAAVVGWRPEPVPALQYTVLLAGEARAAGIMTLPEPVRAAGVGPRWTGYVGVADVDAAAARAAAAGATLRHGPEDIPGVGRFATLTDPQGAPFNLFTPLAAGEAEPGFMTQGRVGWHELHAADREGAWGFYAPLFGWELAETLDMGPMGTYQIFAYDGAARGGFMTAPPGEKPAWLFYFVVAGIDAAADRVRGSGGLVEHGPQEVPGGAWVIQCRDPEGARFALVSGPR